MWCFKRILLTLAGLIPVFGLSAQDFSQWEKLLLTSCLQADFRYESEGNVKLSGEGKIFVQDSCYVLDLNLMQLYCDGVRRWTVDAQDREVVVEKASLSLQGVIAGYAVESCKTQSDGSVHVSVLSWDGTRIRLEIPALKKYEKRDLSAFRFDTEGLDGSWIITDLTL